MLDHKLDMRRNLKNEKFKSTVKSNISTFQIKKIQLRIH